MVFLYSISSPRDYSSNMIYLCARGKTWIYIYTYFYFEYTRRLYLIYFMQPCLSFYLHIRSDFEKSLQVIDLEQRIHYNDEQLEHRPPFDTVISGFCCVSVSSFSDNNVTLFVLHFFDQFGQLSH